MSSKSLSDDETYGSSNRIVGVDKVVEAGQIGFRLAEEVRSLREELLDVKQQKRILIAKQVNLEQELAESNQKASALTSKIESLVKDSQDSLLAVNQSETATLQLKEVIKQFKVERKLSREEIAKQRRKNELLGKELEKSLEDEVSLRNYCRDLESRCVELEEKRKARSVESGRESGTREQLLKLVDQSVRYHMLQSKRLEALLLTVSEQPAWEGGVVGSEAGESAAATALEQHAVSEYYDALLQVGSSNSSGVTLSSAGAIDISSLEHRLKSVDHQFNQHVNSIRHQVLKMRRQAVKSRSHMRSLLQVVRTYEEMLPATATTGQVQTPSNTPFHGMDVNSSNNTNNCNTTNSGSKAGSTAGGNTAWSSSRIADILESMERNLS